MGDLDTSLIKEFAARPAFYNKTSPNFKDKVYIELAWMEISLKLGYDVSLLKDRMYQLRNRYNLEKRKVEAMKNEGIHNPKSSWVLFRHLTFLDGHIRPRKSYKSMMKKGVKDDTDYAPPSAGSSAAQLAEVKYENEDNEMSESYPCEYETEDEGGKTSNKQNNEDFINPANFLNDDSESDIDVNNDVCQQSISSVNMNNESNNTKNLSLRSNTRKRSLQPINENSMDYHSNTKMFKSNHQSTDKFDAFGTFITASLLDLPEIKALELIEKFTNDIVRALINNSSSLSGNSGSGGGVGGGGGSGGGNASDRHAANANKNGGSNHIPDK